MGLLLLTFDAVFKLVGVTVLALVDSEARGNAFEVRWLAVRKVYDALMLQDAHDVAVTRVDVVPVKHLELDGLVKFG